MIRAIALLIAASIAAAPAGAESALADPFAGERAMNEKELAAARGGLVAAGFIIDFSIESALSVTSIGSVPDLGGLSARFDQALNTLVITNTLNDVRVVHDFSLNAVISNYDLQRGSTIASSAGATSTHYFAISPF